jgi:hypothetical protein
MRAGAEEQVPKLCERMGPLFYGRLPVYWLARSGGQRIYSPRYANGPLKSLNNYLHVASCRILETPHNSARPDPIGRLRPPPRLTPDAPHIAPLWESARPNPFRKPKSGPFGAGNECTPHLPFNAPQALRSVTAGWFSAIFRTRARFGRVNRQHSPSIGISAASNGSRAFPYILAAGRNRAARVFGESR